MKERKRFIDGMMKLTLYKKFSLIAILSLIIFSGAQAESQLDELRRNLDAKGKERQEAEKKLNEAGKAEKKAEDAYNKAKKEVLARENECKRQMGLLNRPRNQIPFCRITDEKHREVLEKERIYNDKKEEFDNARNELNGIIRELQGIERRYNLELQASERADREEDRALKAGDAIRQAIIDCKFGKAARDIGSLSHRRVKTMLQNELETAKRREKDVSSLYKEGMRRYKEEAQPEEKAGNLEKARDAYKQAFTKLKEARDKTRCKSRITTIDKKLAEIRHRFAEVKKKIAAQESGTKQEWLSDEEAKALMKELWDTYNKKWSDEWCIHRPERTKGRGQVNWSGCAVESLIILEVLTKKKAWWARTREKQGIVRRLAKCYDPCVMKDTSPQDRAICYKDCEDRNPMPK